MTDNGCARETDALMGQSIFERMLPQEERERYMQHRLDRYTSHMDGFEEAYAYLMSDECTADIERILDHDFTLPIPRKVLVRKANTNRRRTLFVYPPRQQALFSYLSYSMHEYDNLYSDSLYSFRQGKRLITLFDQIMRAGFAQDQWVFKADVRDYFYSIKPWHLIPMLEKYVEPRDPLLFSFLESMLTTNTYIWNDEVEHGYMGGLQGVPMAVMFGNTYLMELDDLIDERSSLNVRYSDDIAAFVNSKEELESLYADSKAILDKLELEFNTDKTRLLAPGESLELLGIQLRDANFDVADNTLAKAKYKLRNFAHKLVLREQRGILTREEAAVIFVNRINRYFYGHEGQRHRLNWKTFFFMVVTRPDSLHDLDLYVQDLIRYVATGKRTNAKYRMTYKAMCDLGYKPLVHEYYAFRKEMYLKQHELGEKERLAGE